MRKRVYSIAYYKRIDVDVIRWVCCCVKSVLLGAGGLACYKKSAKANCRGNTLGDCFNEQNRECKTPNECARMCDKNPQCKGFSFLPGSKRCILKKMACGAPQSNANVDFYTKSSTCRVGESVMEWKERHYALYGLRLVAFILKWRFKTSPSNKWRALSLASCVPWCGKVCVTRISVKE